MKFVLNLWVIIYDVIYIVKQNDLILLNQI